MVAAEILADPRAASVEEIFEAAGALRRGHFALKSGRHSDRYLEKFAVLQYPTLAVEIGRRLAESLAAHDPTLVVGPTTGGVLLALRDGPPSPGTAWATPCAASSRSRSAPGSARCGAAGR